MIDRKWGGLASASAVHATGPTLSRLGGAVWPLPPHHPTPTPFLIAILSTGLPSRALFLNPYTNTHMHVYLLLWSGHVGSFWSQLCISFKTSTSKTTSPLQRICHGLIFSVTSVSSWSTVWKIAYLTPDMLKCFRIQILWFSKRIMRYFRGELDVALFGMNLVFCFTWNQFPGLKFFTVIDRFFYERPILIGGRGGKAPSTYT